MNTRTRGRDRSGTTGGLRAPGRRWARWLERLLQGVPFVGAVGLLGLVSSDPGSGLRSVAAVVLGLTAVALRAGVPICLSLDAAEVSRSTVRWDPNRWLYAGAAVLLAPSLVGLAYLYRRYDLVRRPAPGPHWWLAVALAAFVAPVAVAVVLTGDVAPVTGLAVATALAAGLLPVGIFRDAAHVTAGGGPWRPNPALYLGFAYVALPFFVLQPALAAYYLGRRSRDGPAAGDEGPRGTPDRR